MTSWEVVLLLALLGTALLLVAALLLASRLHRARAAQAARAEAEAARLLGAWATRPPTAEELDRLGGVPSRERRLLLGAFFRELPDAASDAVPRAREALERTHLLAREPVRLGHRSPAERAEACRLLGRLGTAAAIPLLLERLGDRDPDVRRAAITALGDLRAAEALGPVAEAIETGGEWDNVLALMAMVRLGSDPAQVGGLLDGARSPAMTKAMLLITGRLGAAADAGRVRALAAHSDLEVRVEALRALGGIGPEPE